MAQQSEWIDRWEDLQAYAGHVSLTYCRRRYGTDSPAVVDETRDEALSDAWVESIEGKTPEEAIVRACDRITKRRRPAIAPDFEPGFNPAEDHTVDWTESAWRVEKQILSLPETLQPIALVLAFSDHEIPQEDLAEMVGIPRTTLRRRLRQIREAIPSPDDTRGDFLQWAENAFVA